MSNTPDLGYCYTPYQGARGHKILFSEDYSATFPCGKLAAKTKAWLNYNGRKYETERLVGRFAEKQEREVMVNEIIGMIEGMK